MRVCTTTKEPHSLYIGVVCVVQTRKCSKVPPRTAVLRSRGGVTHSGETRLTRTDISDFYHIGHDSAVKRCYLKHVTRLTLGK